MKLRVKTSWWNKLFSKVGRESFTPITVTMELETPAECRTMFHILNHCDLPDVILNRNYYGNADDGKLGNEYTKKLDLLNCGKPNEQHLVIEMNRQNISPMANGHIEYK